MRKVLQLFLVCGFASFFLHDLHPCFHVAMHLQAVDVDYIWRMWHELIKKVDLMFAIRRKMKETWVLLLNYERLVTFQLGCFTVPSFWRFTSLTRFHVRNNYVIKLCQQKIKPKQKLELRRSSSSFGRLILFLFNNFYPIRISCFLFLLIFPLTTHTHVVKCGKLKMMWNRKTRKVSNYVIARRNEEGRKNLFIKREA